MEKYILTSIILFLTCTSSLSYADAAGWSGEAKITSIYALSDNSAVIKLSSFSNPNACSTNSTGDIWINPSSQNTWFTMLLSAFMAGKTVNIFVTAACDTTHWAGLSFGHIGHVRVFE